MSRWTYDAGPAEIMLPMLMLGFGFPLMVVPLFASALAAVERPKAIKAASLMNLILQLGGAFGTAVITTLLERGTTLYHAQLVAQARPDHPAWAEATRQVTAVIMRGGSDAVTAQQQALAALDRIITGQATVLSFEHAFLIIAVAFTAALLATPFLAGRPGSAPPSVSVDH